MRERLELGSLTTVDGRSLPQRVDFLAPSAYRRVQWIVGALACGVLVWSVALTAGWLRVSGWLIAVRRFPRGAEHLLWSFPLLFAFVCLAMAVSGVRVVIDADTLGVFCVWPRPYRRTFDLARLRGADFRPERTPGSEPVYRIDFVFDRAEVILRMRDRVAWEALQARFRDRLGR